MTYLDIHTHQKLQQTNVQSVYSVSFSNEIEIEKAQPISVGIHPWYVQSDNLDQQIEGLTTIAKQENVKMIGECGLDRLKGLPLAEQIIIFEKQIQLAETLKKPLIIHCVRCFDELIGIKKRLKVQSPMIIHGFNKKPDLGQKLIAHGFYLSFGADVLNPNSTAAACLQEINSPFFLETDESNESIQSIYHAAANLRKVSENQLKDVIFAAWKKINIL